MMKLFSLEEEKIEIIPVAYNYFLYNLEESYKIAKSINLSEKFLEDFIYPVQKKIESGKLLILDMSNIGIYDSRFFSKLRNEGEQIIFCSVEEVVAQSLKEDMQFENQGYYLYNNGFPYLSGKEFDLDYSLEELIKKLNKDFLDKVILEITDKKRHFLSSSGIWLDNFINVKKLFETTENLTYIIYKLCEKIISKKEYINSTVLVASSLNGGILAGLIAEILDKKMITYMVGPKFSLPIENSNEMAMRPKYLYIFDVICLGTELKILNALMKSKKIDLIGGVGVASYTNFENENNKNTILEKMSSLINITTGKIELNA